MTKDIKDHIKYIKCSAGDAYSKIAKFLENNHLFVFFLTKKLVGKSHYIQELLEVFPDQLVNISMGGTVRQLQERLDSGKLNTAIWDDKVVRDLQRSSVKKLLPLDTVEKIFDHQIASIPPGKSVLYDGLPRKEEQVDLVAKKTDLLATKGFTTRFLEIDLAEGILDQRLTSRRICPQCGYTDNILTPSIDNFGYNKETTSFFIICPNCQVPLTRKKGDKLSPAITQRRQKFNQMIVSLRQVIESSQYVYLRTDLPRNKFNGNPEEELNLSTRYSLDNEDHIQTKKEPQTAKLEGQSVFSLNPQAAVVKIIQELSCSLPHS